MASPPRSSTSAGRARPSGWVAVLELVREVLKVVVHPHGLSYLVDDPDGERVAPDAGQMLAQQVGGTFAIPGGRCAYHLDVVAFPVHLLATGGLSCDAGKGVEIGDGEAEAAVGYYRATERESGLVAVGGPLSPPIPSRRRQVRADGTTVVLDRTLVTRLLILPAASLPLTSKHDCQSARAT
jgi:hypothetical protein